jgi:hypothetical protein
MALDLGTEDPPAVTPEPVDPAAPRTIASPLESPHFFFGAFVPIISHPAVDPDPDPEP